jgi:hypothetical protein
VEGIKVGQKVWVESVFGAYPAAVVDVFDEYIEVWYSGGYSMFRRSGVASGAYKSSGGLILHTTRASVDAAKEYRHLQHALRAAIEAGPKIKITLSQLRQIAAILKVAEQDKE